jgi:Fe-S-cluster containining protein
MDRMAESVNVAFDLKIGGDAVRVSLKVPADPVPARRLLPLFQGIAHQIVDAAVDQANRGGETVSCKSGCGACCRQLVAISKTEARAIRALVDAMPEPKRTEVRARFTSALTRIEEAGLLGAVRALDSLPEESELGLSRRYMQLSLACPFLEEESCSIHPQRPIVCREYLVTSSPEHCRTPFEPGVCVVPLHDKVSQALVPLDAGPGSRERVALALALEWSEAHGDDEPVAPAVEWIERVLLWLTGRSVKDAAEKG